MRLWVHTVSTVSTDSQCVPLLPSAEWPQSPPFLINTNVFLKFWAAQPTVWMVLEADNSRCAILGSTDVSYLCVFCTCIPPLLQGSSRQLEKSTESWSFSASKETSRNSRSNPGGVIAALLGIFHDVVAREWLALAVLEQCDPKGEPSVKEER